MRADGFIGPGRRGGGRDGGPGLAGGGRSGGGCGRAWRAEDVDAGALLKVERRDDVEPDRGEGEAHLLALLADGGSALVGPVALDPLVQRFGPVALGDAGPVVVDRGDDSEDLSPVQAALAVVGVGVVPDGDGGAAEAAGDFGREASATSGRMPVRSETHRVARSLADLILG